MNIHSQPQLTPAEAALVDSFVERAGDLPGNPEVISRRDDAVEQLKAGLPTRKVEAWHYTDLRRLLTKVPAFDPTADVRQPAPLSAGFGGARGAQRQGRRAVPELAGIKVSRAAARCWARASSLRTLVPTGRDDAVGAVNAALVSDGFRLEIAANAEITAPVELQNLHGGGQAHARFPVKIGDNAKVTIVERQTGRGRRAGLFASAMSRSATRPRSPG